MECEARLTASIRVSSDAALEGVGAAQQIVGQKAIDGSDDRGFTVGPVSFPRRTAVQHQTDHESRREQHGSRGHPWRRARDAASRCSATRARSFARSSSRLSTRRISRFRIWFDQDRHAGHMLRRIATGRGSDILAQQGIHHVGFPPRREWFSEIAGQHLIKHDAEGIHVGGSGGRMPGEHLGREVHQRTGQRVRVVTDRLRESQIGDAQGVEAVGFHEPSAAEIGDLHLVANRPRRHQDIGRLQILMQHAGIVRRRHALCGFYQDGEPFGERDALQPPICLGPLQQILPAEFAFEVERWRVEIPFQHADEIRPLAQRFA